MTGPEQHAATVRDAIVEAEASLYDAGHVDAAERHAARLAALDELVALASEAETAKDELENFAQQVAADHYFARAEAAEARADELQLALDLCIKQRESWRAELTALKRDRQVLVMRNSALQDKLLGLDTSPAALAGVQADNKDSA